MDYKQLIIDSLDIMYQTTKADGEVFKAKAYAKVIAQIKTVPAIRSFEDVKDIAGIGAKIKDKIKEIMATGQLSAAQRAKESHNLDALNAFQNVYGIGPTKAKDLVKAGFRTIAELREAAQNPEKPNWLNDNIAIGLKYYENFLERIPRKEMLEHRTIILQNATAFDSEIVGSFRRGMPNSGDIDVLLSGPRATVKEFKSLVEKLKASGYITDVLALGNKKCMAVCTVGNGSFRRLDLLLTPVEEYPFAILYFTGSDKFNIAMRQHALDRGYTLNEHALTPIRADVPPPPPMKSEADIFVFLEMPFTEPQAR
jgi:DNA polymerase/3'-5' exonuclease PolX